MSDEKILTYVNLVGANRYDTSIRVSKEAYPKGTNNIILVNGTTNIDVILAEPLANKLSAPVLRNPKDKLMAEIKNEINRIRVSSTNYKNCHNFQSDIQYMAHLLSFVYEFLENETDFQEFGGSVEFEILLKLQIEKMLHQNGGRGTRSEFSYSNKNDIRMNFLKYTSFEFGKILSEYLGAKGERIDFTIVENKYKLNETLLNDMNVRPEKYLFVLDATEENSIVPKKTRDKIAECARRIELEESELSER
mgnify:CR=1 FL=1